MKNVETVSAILNIIREYSEANPEMGILEIFDNIGLSECLFFEDTSAKTLARLQKVGK